MHVAKSYSALASLIEKALPIGAIQDTVRTKYSTPYQKNINAIEVKFNNLFIINISA